MPTTIPMGGSSAREKGEHAVSDRPGARPRDGRPRRRSGASDHTPIRASSSTIFSSSVSIARKASSTAVTGLPTPVAPAFSAAAGASVGAGSGRNSTRARRARP